MLFTKLFNKSTAVGVAIILSHGSQIIHAMERSQDIEYNAKLANQCVSCYQQTTPTHIVHCTSCPRSPEQYHLYSILQDRPQLRQLENFRSTLSLNLTLPEYQIPLNLLRPLPALQLLPDLQISPNLLRPLPDLQPRPLPD